MNMVAEAAPETCAAVSKLKTFGLVFAVILLNAVGNLSLAWGMRRVAAPMALNPADYIRAMFTPYVALGIVLLILWLLARMTLLSWADLSFVLPLTGLGYILAAVLGKVFLAEVISPGHWTGTFFVFFGTLLVGATKQKTAKAEGAGH